MEKLLLITLSLFVISSCSFKKEEEYYLIQTLVYPTPTFLLDKNSKTIGSFDGQYIDFSEEWGMVIVKHFRDLKYYNTKGELRFSKSFDRSIHHAIKIDPRDGSLVFPAKKKEIYNGKEVSVDSILRLSKEGKIISIFSTSKSSNELFDFIKPIFHRDIVKTNHFPTSFGDESLGEALFHFNHIQILPDNKAAKFNSAFRKGNILTADPNFSLFLILDQDTFEIVWKKSFFLDHMELVKKSWVKKERVEIPNGFTHHSPEVNSNGLITFFRNQDFIKRMKCYELEMSGQQDKCDPNGLKYYFSSIIQYDPIKNKEVFKLAESKDLNFGTELQGSVFLEKNKNFLITGSEKGIFYEVDKEGRKLFEYNIREDRLHPSKPAIYKTRKVPKKLIEPFLKLVL